MKIIPKVFQSGYLPNIKGSPFEKEAFSQRFSDNTFEWVRYTLLLKQQKKQPVEITQNEVSDFFKRNYQGINVNVEHGTGYLGAIFDNQQENYLNTHFAMGLEFSKNKKWENVLNSSRAFGIFFHEFRHFCDLITAPKHLAKKGIQRSLLVDKVADSCDLFYDKKIYTFMPSLFPLEKKIQSFFKKAKFTSHEKIAVLQNWRHGIKREINAYDDGCNKTAKLINFLRDKKIKNISIEPAWYVRVFKEYFKFPEKLNIVESMLAQEIKDHRAKHVKSLKAKRISPAEQK